MLRCSTIFSGNLGLVIILLMVFDAPASDPGDWTGWHAGLFGGFMSGKLNSDNPAHEESTKDYTDDKPIAGIDAGYYRQFTNDWVVGAEVTVPLYMKKGTATDKKYYPDSVKYEANYRYGALLSVKAGKAFGIALPYVYGAIGFVNINGKTLNVDENDLYAPGASQSAAATHLVWQLGAGIDHMVSDALLLGARVAAFDAARADHTMPWNEPGPNNFGYKSVLLQFNISYRF